MIEQEEPIEVREAKIRAEIGDDWRNYMNNFWNNTKPDGYPRRNSQEMGRWNVKNKDQDPEGDHSVMYLEQSDEEFFATIDKVIDEMDKDGEIRKILNLLKPPYKNLGKIEVLEEKLNQKLLPVFIRLKAMGYTWGELSG